MRTTHGLAALGAALGFAGAAQADLLAYWNFNTTGGSVYSWASDAGAGTITVDAGFTQVGTASGSALNALFGDLAGNALNLRSNSNNGRGLDIAVSMTGCGALQLSFAATRNTQGFDENKVLYSTDGGANFTEFGPYNPPTAFGVLSFDLSSITALDNEANVVIRLLLDGAGNNGGQTSIDNLQINATVVPGAPVLAVMAVAGLAARRKRRR